MKNNLKYEYLKISVEDLIDRIRKSDSSALKYNAFVEGSIVGVPVGNLIGRVLYHQFERTNGNFRDLGLSA